VLALAREVQNSRRRITKLEAEVEQLLYGDEAWRKVLPVAAAHMADLKAENARLREAGNQLAAALGSFKYREESDDDLIEAWAALSGEPTP
jgi:hypothetical protein